MNNKGKKVRPVKSPRPSHSGRPVSVKKTSSGLPEEKEVFEKKNPIKILQRIVLICIIVIVAFAACALGYAFLNAHGTEWNSVRTGRNIRECQRKWRTGTMAGRRSTFYWCGASDTEFLFRPQISIEQVNYIAIHYTANPGSTAISNRNYFENLATTQDNKVSSHFVIGLEGEVVQCIPTSEISYATNSRNVDTISIECCHPDETGQFNTATYDSAVKLTAWLCTRFDWLRIRWSVIMMSQVKTVRSITWKIPMHGSRWNQTLQHRSRQIMHYREIKCYCLFCEQQEVWKNNFWK